MRLARSKPAGVDQPCHICEDVKSAVDKTALRLSVIPILIPPNTIQQRAGVSSLLMK